MEELREAQNPNPEKVEVPVHPDTLRWALEWSRLGVEEAARKVGVREEKLRAWLEGQAKPTYAQARKLAKALHLGLPKLLLPPPKEGPKLPVKDLRRGPSFGERPSPELLEATYDALRKQDWWRERRREPLPFVGSGKAKAPHEVAEELRELLDLEALWKAPRVEDFLRRLVSKVEELGVLVLRQGHVGTNTRRVYDPGEFSGFALVDPVAPVVFVNARDYPRRQVFTLAHELAHVWRGEGGLDGALEEEPQAEVEAWADEVAAAFLMPEEAFREAWPQDRPPLEAAREASERFKVSKLAALRRALGLGLIPKGSFLEALEALKGGEPPPPRGGGGDFWRALEVQNSPAFTRELRKAAQEGEVDAKEVAYLLNVSLRTAWEFLTRGQSEPVSP